MRTYAWVWSAAFVLTACAVPPRFQAPSSTPEVSAPVTAPITPAAEPQRTVSSSTEPAALPDTSAGLVLLGWDRNRADVNDAEREKIKAFIASAPAGASLQVIAYCDGNITAKAHDVAVNRGSRARQAAIAAGFPITRIFVRTVTREARDGVVYRWR